MTVGWFFKGIGQYADFHQRARRREYWWFIITGYLVVFALLAFTAVTLGDAYEGWTFDPADVRLSGWIMIGLTSAVSLFLLIPTWAVTVRRLHDQDKSAWWLLFLFFLPIVIFILSFFDGTVGPNRYGPDPKELERGPEA
ncbi:DUF805 domain-containing protein [Demequina sp. NBRC 110056]|uniref:DUF805 domain-containing protein n=1 Tax=Demequina sp. NBRC 110056 TaxID=1570345 RepID=UPI0009FCD293|nr:DUF805 domain-containing protein [Demequina sp. NBRC 110056]